MNNFNFLAGLCSWVDLGFMVDWVSCDKAQKAEKIDIIIALYKKVGRDNKV